MIRKGVSQSAIRNANARAAVGTHLNVQWTDSVVTVSEQVYPTRNDGIQASISTSPYVSNGSPSLIFVFSDETKPLPKTFTSKKIDPDPTQQAKDSEAAWAELFQKEGDYSIFLAGRFFNVVKMDATSIHQLQNKYLSSEKAPMVILTRKDGQVVTVFDGRAKIKNAVVTKAMCDILQKDQYITGTSQFAALNALMVELEKIEASLLDSSAELKKRTKKLTDAEAKTGGGDADENSPKSVIAAAKAASDAEAVLKQKLKAKYVILEKEYTLLKNLGLPPSKMPPEPVEPK